MAGALLSDWTAERELFGDIGNIPPRLKELLPMKSLVNLCLSDMCDMYGFLAQDNFVEHYYSGLLHFDDLDESHFWSYEDIINRPPGNDILPFHTPYVCEKKLATLLDEKMAQGFFYFILGIYTIRVTEVTGPALQKFYCNYKAENRRLRPAQRKKHSPLGYDNSGISSLLRFLIP